MASSSSTLHANSFECSPKLLKHFLIEDTHSCSSNGFRSYPRKSSVSVIQKVSKDSFTPRSNISLSQDFISRPSNRSEVLPTTKSTLEHLVPELIFKRTNPNKISSELIRSRSKASSSTIIAIHKASEMVTKALKYLPFASNIKSPSILARSISRKLSHKEKYHYSKREVSVKVKVKDILRWRSFRDLVEERSTPLDHLCSSPNRCTTTTTTTTDSTSTTRRSSQSSSWCDSDFTAEEFPSWCYEVVGEGFMEKTRTMDMDPKSNLLINDEYEQHTPVSVLDSPFREDEESIYHRNLSNLDRRKCALMQRINEFESLTEEPMNLENHQLSTEKSTSFDGEDEDLDEAEEKAYKLLNHFKDKSSVKNFDFNFESDQLLFDFFKHELTKNSNPKNDKHESELLSLANNWMSGICEESFEWEVEGKRVNYVSEMLSGLRLNNFEKEQEEMVLQLESLMISSLLEELFD